jgi:aldose 1-epimerase
MSFTIDTRHVPNSIGPDCPLYVLASGPHQATIWPSLGFNCLDWQTQVNGQTVRLLYCDPQLFDNGRPTRSGIPILFPFPNRIRAGRFHWDGKDYQLPLNDSTQQNAIHGFACRKPWRVVEQGTDATSAWLTGEFQGSVDAPETADLWPTDYHIRITYRLSERKLRIEAVVSNSDKKPLPFGLGYHPYFAPRPADSHSVDLTMQAPPRCYWQLQDSLPTGTKLPLDASRDLTHPRKANDLNLDDVYGDLPADGSPLVWRGSVRSPQAELRLNCSPDFRELVIFTPPHRKAVCLEPYTCITDAINLQQRGIDAGWRVVAPGGSWSGIVEMIAE